MYLFRAMQISAKGCVDACIHTHSLALIYMARAIHEQKESLEEAILRMGSEQIWIKKGKDKLCLKDKSVW